MALQVEISLSINSPDGTAQIAIGQADLTLNPAIGDWEIEAGLAKVAVTTLMERVHNDAFTKLEEWTAAMNICYPQEGKTDD